MTESSDKMWSTGEGNGKPLQYSCLENPINSMKRQKDRALKENSPGSFFSSTEELMLLNCWRRFLRVPWTARRSNQSILKDISPGISLEGTMLKLKLQYFGHLMQRADSLEKTLRLGNIEGRRRRG